MQIKSSRCERKAAKNRPCLLLKNGPVTRSGWGVVSVTICFLQSLRRGKPRHRAACGFPFTQGRLPEPEPLRDEIYNSKNLLFFINLLAAPCEAPLCKGGSREAGGGLFLWPFLFLQSLRRGKPRHRAACGFPFTQGRLSDTATRTKKAFSDFMPPAKVWISGAFFCIREPPGHSNSDKKGFFGFHAGPQKFGLREPPLCKGRWTANAGRRDCFSVPYFTCSNRPWPGRSLRATKMKSQTNERRLLEARLRAGPGATESLQKSTRSWLQNRRPYVIIGIMVMIQSALVIRIPYRGRPPPGCPGRSSARPARKNPTV